MTTSLSRRSFLLRSTATAAYIFSPLRPTTDYACVDFETRAVRNLFHVGVHKYCEDPHFSPMCLSWAINNGPVHLWKAGEPFPTRLAEHIKRGGKMHAWNAAFERVVWLWCVEHLKWPSVALTQWRCTMVRSLACGLPGKLEESAIACRITERKDTEGAKAMKKLSSPRNMREIKKNPNVKPIWWEENEPNGPVHQTMFKYCIQDTVTEREIGYYLPLLQPKVEKEWEFDQIVADRGVLIDQDLCHAAIKVAADRRVELVSECRKITGVNPTQLPGIKAWMARKFKLVFAKLDKVQVDKLLARPSLPEPVRRVLLIRQEAGMTSVKKYITALQRICNDGTVKGVRQFYGAHTGRWAGRGVQLDNMPRPTMRVDLDEVADAVLTGDQHYVSALYGNVMESVQNCIRGMLVAGTANEFIADEDEELYVADLKSIESRMLAEMSGQESVTKAWRLSDQGLGPDVYVRLASKFFGCTLKDAQDKDKRGVGKIGELSLGYEGGVGALMKNQDKGDVKFGDLWSTLYKNADDATRSKVDFVWKMMGKTDLERGVTEKDWRAARFIVELWRGENRMSVKFWRRIRLAGVEAVRNPGRESRYRKIVYVFDKASEILFCRLQSGRELKYPFAHLVTAKNFKGDNELQLRSEYFHTKLRRMVKYHPYGGFSTENIDQAQARDAMVDRFPALESVGFQLRHTVHDEIIMSRVKKPGGLELFLKTFAVAPTWAPDLPLAAEGWCGPRYKKQD